MTKAALLDSLVVGGETLSAYAFSGNASSEVQRAYELAYPDVSAVRSFSDQVRDLNAQELEGFVSGIKGKLFELQYVKYLNDEHLPEGFTATIAQSANNPGWDIAIFGADGIVKDTIQAKATESVSYVKEALERYPHIDVVTTSEVYSHLLMQGFAEDVINSGISEDGLETFVEVDIDSVTLTFDWTPSVVSLALIAFSAYNQEGLTAYQKSRNFGGRASKSYVGYLVGSSLAVATQTWWMGVLGAMGSRLVLGTGRRKRDRLSQLKLVVEQNENVLMRLESQAR